VLGEKEGLVVIQVDTDVALESARLGKYEIFRNLPKGRHLWLVRLPAGEYSWSRIALGAESGRDFDLNLNRVDRRMAQVEDWVWDDEFTFDVVPGVLNYPGELIVRYDGVWMSVRNRNHAALAVYGLEESYPQVLATHGLRNAGPGEDGFLEFYTRQRARLGADPQ
jgi:hypothetical protein